MRTERDFFPPGINNYVPGAQYAGALNLSGMNYFSLGSPAAGDDDAIAATIDADAVAGTIELYSYTVDAKYGRNLILTQSADPGAAAGVIDVYGWDYLGQPMTERFTGLNGATGAALVLYGKKAFKKVWKTVIVTAATNAITAKLGTGIKFGLPYKGDVHLAKEAGVLVPVYNRDVTLWRSIGGGEITGGPSGAWVYADFPGFVKSIRTVANMPVGSTNDPAVTVELGGVAITGLTVTPDVSAAATGSLLSDDPTTAGYSGNNRFRPGDLLEIVLTDADANVGGVSVGLVLTPTQFTHPVTTDPQTVATGDPRGLYEPLSAPAGHEIKVGMFLDTDINTSGNGGLFGIKHV